MSQTINENEIQEPTEMIKEVPKAKMNGFQRVVNIFMAPDSVIDDIQIKPNFLVPLALIAVISLLSAFLTKDLMSQLLDITYANAGLTPDQIAQTKEMMSGYLTVMTYVSAILVPLTPVVKGIFAHLLSILFGGKGSFSGTVSLMLNAYLIQMGGMLLALPIILMTGNGAFSFSPSILLPLEKFGTPLYTTLQSLSLFAIWYFVVTIMGVKKLQKVSTLKAALIVLIPFIITIGFSWISVLMGGAPSGL